MGPRQGSLSLTAALVGAAIRLSPVAAQPTELVGCVANRACSDVQAGYFFEIFCPYQWQLFEGRMAFDPLRYVGPIMIDVDARGAEAGSNHPLPLYVECVPVRDHPPELGYCDGVGSLILQVMGRTQCEAWETYGPIDLSHLLSPGDLYVIRLHFVTSWDGRAHSPYFRCLRVAPAATRCHR